MIVHVIVGLFVVIVSTKMEIKIRKINNFQQNYFKTNNKTQIVTEQSEPKKYCCMNYVPSQCMFCISTSFWVLAASNVKCSRYK